MSFKLNISGQPAQPETKVATAPLKLESKTADEILQKMKDAENAKQDSAANDGSALWLVERAIMYLDAACDGAGSRDDVGFNGRDTGFGKSLGSQLRSGKRLTAGQLEAAYKVINTYKNTQLSHLPWDVLMAEKDRALLVALDRKQKAQEKWNVRDQNNKVQQSAGTVQPGSEGVLPNVGLGDISGLHNRGNESNSSNRQPFKLIPWRYSIPGSEQTKGPQPDATAKPGFKLTVSAPAATQVAKAEAPKQPAASTPFVLKTAGLVAAGVPLKPTQAIRVLEDINAARNSQLVAGPDANRIPTITFKRGGKEVTITPDPSQFAAVNGMLSEQFACLTGAAGTGKTTVMRILVSGVEKGLRQIDISNYNDPTKEGSGEDKVPAIAFAAYTGKAMQQQKKALPEEYHSRCHTIHLLLGFHPEFELRDFIDEDGKASVKQVRVFVPLYTEAMKMPWDVIILDEASMIPIHLWNQFIAACRPDTRIYLIGDINQLPPVHGRSVFGFAMLKWPSFELNKIHRQQGENNPIVDNAWRILQGQIPLKAPGFDILNLPDRGYDAKQLILKVAAVLRAKGEFIAEDTHERTGDMIIVSQNKGDIGQIELNESLVTMFNPPPKEYSPTARGNRVHIKAAMKDFIFGIGDKVMVTQNDHELEITNGMTGMIIDIQANGRYSGPRQNQANAQDIENLIANMGKITMSDKDGIDMGDHADEEPLKKRASSHVVTVDFGLKESGEPRIVPFDTVGGVSALMNAYAATCHKMQGSETGTVVVVAHATNHRMMYREWLYTAITRASKRVIFLCNDKGLSLALTRQKIKGANLREKAQSFIELQNEAEAGDEGIMIPVLPEPKELKAK